MIRVFLAAAIAALVIGCCCFEAEAAQDATDEWASIAETYNFDAVPPFTLATFADAYNGSCPCNLRADFESAWAAMNELMNTHVPPGDAGDVMSTTLSNWPDPD